MGLARAGRTDQQDVALLNRPHPGDRRSATMGSGASRSQVSTRRLKWLLTPRARRLLAMFCPITYWSRWATRVLGAGIEARRASLEGRSGGGVGSGTGWGVISARALVAAEGADACRRIEAALKERDVVVEAEVAARRLSSDMGTPKARRIRTTHAGRSNTPFDGVSQIGATPPPAEHHRMHFSRQTGMGRVTNR